MVVPVLHLAALNRSVFGRNTPAIGGNPEASRLAGVVHRRRQAPWIFTIQGLVGAAWPASFSPRASPLPGSRTRQQASSFATSACVLGGVSLAGGRAAMTGVIVGVLILGIAENAMNLLNIRILPVLWYVA